MRLPLGYWLVCGLTDKDVVHILFFQSPIAIGEIQIQLQALACRPTARPRRRRPAPDSGPKTTPGEDSVLADLQTP